MAYAGATAQPFYDIVGPAFELSGGINGAIQPPAAPVVDCRRRLFRQPRLAIRFAPRQPGSVHSDPGAPLSAVT